MRMVFGLVLIAGLGLAGFAVYMAQGYVTQYKSALANERAARTKQVKMTKVFIAKKKLQYGEQIKQEHLQLVDWPASYLPEGVFQKVEEIFPDGSPKYRTVLRSMEINEPLLAMKVTAPGEDAGITSRLTKGMRAFAIKVDVSSGVSGFLRPGDRVDVYWTGSARGRQRVTKLIGASIRLIAVDQISDVDRQNPIIARTVTVETNPKQIAALAQAQSTGRLSLSLVGASDDGLTAGVEIDQNELLGIVEEKEVVQVEKKEKVCTIKTRRGAEVVDIPIPCTN